MLLAAPPGTGAEGRAEEVPAQFAQKGDQFGFSSPVIDGSRVYQVENGSRLKAYDLEKGALLWTQTLGTVQKAPLVLADGKLYVGTESGKFFIVITEW